MAKQRIAIVGGGMAALAAAFQLTRSQNQRERFDITIYQMGWRLGGKGATGRDSQGRVVEHGLHIWFGCYENAFRMLRAAYEEWEPLAHQAIVSCEDALKPQRDSAIGVGDGSDVICLHWPRICGEPGVGIADLSPFSSFSQMLTVMQCFYDQLVQSELVDSAPRDLPLDVGTIALLKLAGVDVDIYIHSAPGELKTEVRRPSVKANLCLALASDWSRKLASSEIVRNEAQFRTFVAFIRNFAKNVLASHKILKSSSRKFLAELVDVGTAAIKGIVVDMMLGGASVGDLDLMDFREWLAACGAHRDSVYGSPIVQALYDSMLQYCDGDKRRPSYGAGTAAQAVVRLYGTYKDTFAFEMQAGMGEVVVTPLYRVLKQRGVKFQFFYKLKEIKLDVKKTSVSQIEFYKQVGLRSGNYNPTIAPDRCNGYLECWPDAPLWDQIVNGGTPTLRRLDFESYWCSYYVDTVTLQQGLQFDAVVLAIPLGAFKKLNAAPGPCDELIAASNKFRAMTEMATLVPSIAVQAWCNWDVTQLGWPPEEAVPSGAAEKTVLSTGPDPLDIWADMSQVLRYEPWESYPEGPKSLQYLCGVLETDLFRAPPNDVQVPADAKALARDKAVNWFSDKARYIWPNSSPGGGFDWTILFDPKGAKGSGRVDAQVYLANVDPSSCCVGSPAGSTQWRLATDASDFGNLYLAGTWIDCGFNTECIEAAVISGLQAARAVAGTSFAIPGENFLQFGNDLPSLIALAAEEAILLVEAAAEAAWDSSGVEMDRRNAWSRSGSRKGK
jgi:uncharacterized protein with NAD-binding domain and iron-sulfur cluster